MIVQMIQNLENKMELQINRLETGIEKMQEMFNKDVEEIKKGQSIMNNVITEIKSTLEGINSRITEAEERISEVDCGSDEERLVTSAAPWICLSGLRLLQVRGKTSFSVPDPTTPGNAALGNYWDSNSGC